MPKSNASDEGADGGVSWVYTKKKEELAKDLRWYKLETGGTLEEMRKRMTHFLRTGEGQVDGGTQTEEASGGAIPKSTKTTRPTTTPQPPRILLEPPSTVPQEEGPPSAIAVHFAPYGVAPEVRPSRAQVCDSVRKWGIRFDGTTDPISFLERIEELIHCYSFSQNDMLSALPEVFKDKVLLWYRNNKDAWRSWDEFVRDFKERYLPPRFQFWIEEEVRNRTQGQKETAAEYVTAIQTLMRRGGETSPGRQLERVYENLKPEYKWYIKRREFQNMNQLMKLASEYESLQDATQFFRTPPASAQAYVAETAYQYKKPKEYVKANPAMCAVQESKVETRRPMGPVRISTPARAPQEKREATNNESGNARYGDQAICWRCGKKGHIKPFCREAQRIFCSWCGRNGVLTRDCKCNQSGNADRPLED